MKLTYDKTVDALYIHMQTGHYAHTKKVTSDILVDVDEQGKVIGVEVLSASKNIASFKPDLSAIRWQTIASNTDPAPSQHRVQ